MYLRMKHSYAAGNNNLTSKHKIILLYSMPVNYLTKIQIKRAKENC